jgi:hypothetical protein
MWCDPKVMLGGTFPNAGAGEGRRAMGVGEAAEGTNPARGLVAAGIVANEHRAVGVEDEQAHGLWQNGVNRPV